MGKAVTPAFNNPLDIIQIKGRTYIAKRGYIKLQVFTMWYSEVDLLRTAFGGNYYNLKNGFVWILGNRDAIIGVVEELGRNGRIPTKHLLEKPVIEFYKK